MYITFVFISIALVELWSTRKSEISNIVAVFRGMHVSPAKHSYAWLPRKCDYRTDARTDGRTDRQTPDKVIPMCRYASQATQKWKILRTVELDPNISHLLDWHSNKLF